MIDRSAFLALEQAISLSHTPPAVHTPALTHSHALVYHKTKPLQLSASIPTLVYQPTLVNIFYFVNHKFRFHDGFHPHPFAEFILSEILRSLRSLRMTVSEGLRMAVTKHPCSLTQSQIAGGTAKFSGYQVPPELPRSPGAGVTGSAGLTNEVTARHPPAPNAAYTLA